MEFETRQPKKIKLASSSKPVEDDIEDDDKENKFSNN